MVVAEVSLRSDSDGEVAALPVIQISNLGGTVENLLPSDI